MHVSDLSQDYFSLCCYYCCGGGGSEGDRQRRCQPSFPSHWRRAPSLCDPRYNKSVGPRHYGSRLIFSIQGSSTECDRPIIRHAVRTNDAHTHAHMYTRTAHLAKAQRQLSGNRGISAAMRVVVAKESQIEKGCLVTVTAVQAGKRCAHSPFRACNAADPDSGCVRTTREPKPQEKPDRRELTAGEPFSLHTYISSRRTHRSLGVASASCILILYYMNNNNDDFFPPHAVRKSFLFSFTPLPLQRYPSVAAAAAAATAAL